MRKRIIGILLAIAVLASLIAVLPVNAETPGPLKQVVITPSTVTLPVGGTQQFSAQGQDDNHVSIPNLTYTWAVVVAGGGSISNTGLFTAGNVPGSFPNTVLVAANQGSTVKVGLASVSITPVPGPLDHVVITPGQATLKGGSTKQFSAQGYDASNVPIPNLTYSWSVVAVGGTISSTGLFTAGNVGGSFPNTVQVATTQGTITKTANASVTVETPGPLKQVVITPSTVTLLAGGTQQFSAQGQDDNHVPIPNLTYTWVVVASGGTISNTGLFTAGSVGGSFKNTVLVAVGQGSTVKVGLASVSITPVPGPLDHVVITPGQATLKAGGTKQFSAKGYDASNVPIPNLTYSWSVVAVGGTISSTGLFTAGNVGGSFPNTVQVATTQGTITKTANASVTVETPGPLKQVVITPSTVTLLAGGTQQFSAQGQDDNHVPIPNLTYTWVVVASGGTISNTGLFTAGSVGGSFKNTVLVAVGQGSTVKVDYASVSITPVPGPLDHVVITPGQATLKAGGTKQFSAKGYDASNVPIPNLTYSWSVMAVGGTISSTGLFTAGNVGGSFPNTVLVATTQGAITKTANASVTVTPLPTPATILKLDATKLLMLVAGTVGVTDFDNFLGAQWTIRDNGQMVTVKAVPGKVTAINKSSITIIPNDPTLPQTLTFTITTETKILADKKGVGVDKQVVVVVAGDTTWLIAQMSTSEMKKLFPSGWFKGKKLGWYNWQQENDHKD